MAARKHINWDKHPLGKKRDTDIARTVGCSPKSVRAARIARGIPRYRSPEAVARSKREAEKTSYVEVVSLRESIAAKDAEIAQLKAKLAAVTDALAK